MARRICSAALLGVMWFHPGAAQDAPPPEAASGRVDRAAVTAERYMIVTANPVGQRCRGRRAGARRQRRRRDGGGPARAEPGRAAIVRHRRRRLPALLGRQGQQAHHASTGARPRRAAAGRTCSCKPDGTPMPFERRWPAADRSACPAPWRCSSWRTGCTAGCHGPTWSQPAADLAEKGFEISPRLAGAIADDAAKLTAGSRRRGPISWAPTARRGSRGPCCATRSSRRPCARSRPRAALRSIAAGSATRSSRPCAARRSIRAR